MTGFVADDIGVTDGTASAFSGSGATCTARRSERGDLALAPKDVYAGFLSDDTNGAIAWTSPDSACTAPAKDFSRCL